VGAMDYIFDLEKNRDKLIEYKNFLTSIKDTEGALMPALQKSTRAI
jgi:hypothetical protein